jgi:hypothetical protein
MRVLLTLLPVMLASPLFAQRMIGKVTDLATQKPASFAEVSVPGSVVYTNANGSFTLNSVRKTDTIKVDAMGFSSYQMPLTGSINADTLRINLVQRSIMLKDINVGGRRDARIDSLRNRRMFSSVYNYKGTTVKDAMVDKNAQIYVPPDRINNTSNTTNIAGMNLLGVIGLLTKNKNSITKLQKDMIRDEEGSYVDRKFSKDKIVAITKLQGDSLKTFMLKYRPTTEQVRSMSDYDMLAYIKRSYALFKAL